jgi:hypothetical protein
MQQIIQFRGRIHRLLLASLLGSVAAVSSAFAQVDLALHRQRTATTLSLEKKFFAPEDCAIREGCVRAGGWRTLLRFDVAVVNIGRSDLVLGDPTSAPHLYEWSPCHEHYHYRGLITYEIFNLRGRVVARGAKQAFCLRDNYKYLRNAPDSHGYDCEFQGLTAGWEDVYDKSLDCQWLDVTGLKPGTYTMRATVNRNRKLRERNYRNNSFSLRISIPRAVTQTSEGSEHTH